MSTTLRFFFIVVLAVSLGSVSALDQVELPPQLRTEEPTANGTLVLGSSLFNKISAALIPIIEGIANSIVIPGEKTDHFSFGPIKVVGFRIAGFTYEFLPPNKLVVHLTGLAMDIPHTEFKVYQKIIFMITCAGEFWAGTSGTNIHMTFTLANVKGKLAVTQVTPNWQFGSLVVQHKLKDLLCKVGQWIVELFIGSIDKKIRQVLAEKMPQLIAQVLPPLMNDLFALIPFPLLSDPVLGNGEFLLSVNLLPITSELALSPLPRDSPFTAAAESLTKDIKVIMPDASVNIILHYLWAHGFMSLNITVPGTIANTSIIKDLLPAAYALCPDCPFSVETEFRNSPTVSFVGGSGTTAVENMIFGINALNQKNVIVPLLDVNLNFTGYANNFSSIGPKHNIILFKIHVPVLSVSLYASNIGPIDDTILNIVVGLLVKGVLIPMFNNNFPGLPAPTLGNVTLQELVVVPDNKELLVALDVNMSKTWV